MLRRAKLTTCCTLARAPPRPHQSRRGVAGRKGLTPPCRAGCTKAPAGRARQQPATGRPMGSQAGHLLAS
eukprot:776705-Alexandrium_andersonii.AAC.1